MKKLLSVIMSVVLVVGLMPLPAFAQPTPAEGGYAAGASELFQGAEQSNADATLSVQSGLQDQKYEAQDSQGNGYWMQYDEVTKDDGTTGIVIWHIGIDRGGTDVVVPSRITDKEDNTYPVIGLGYDRDDGFSWFRSGNAKTITIPASVQTISHVYFDSAGYDGVVFESGSPITEMYPAIFKGSSIKQIDLPNGLEAIYDNMFERSSIESIKLPDAAKEIGYRAFNYAGKLTAVTFNDGLETIGEEAFANMPGTGFDGYAGGYYYNDGPKMTTVNIPDSVTSIEAAAFRKICALESVSLGTSPQSSKLRVIGDRAFFGNNVTSIVVPDAVESIGAEAFSGTNAYAAYDGSGGDHVLTNLQLGSSQDASHLMFLGPRAFAQQPITSVSLPNSLVTLGFETDDYGYDDYRGFTSKQASGKELSRFLFGAWDANLEASTGAFSGCSELRTVVWPTQPGLSTIGGFDGCNSLSEETVNSIPSWVSVIDDYAFYNCVKPGQISYAPYNRTYAATDLMNITIPSTVAKIGKGAFSKSSKDEYALVPGGATPTYTILNPDVSLDWGESEYEWPWPAGCGYTICYPASASADSDIVKYRAVVEQREAEIASNRSSYDFTNFVVMPDGLPNAHSNAYEFDPDKVAPEVDTGSLQVTVTKDRPTANERFAAAIGCNVAVFDAAGKLVDQAKTPTSAMVITEGLAPGSYTVVGFDGNEWFSGVSSLDDFARLGVVAGTWATANVTVEQGETTAIELPVPDLKMTASAGDILSDGSVVVATQRVVPDSAFYARVSYTMKDGRAANKVQLNIPEGLQPVSVNSTAYSYDISGFDAATRVFTVEPKAAESASGVLLVGLKAAVPGTYNVSATVASGAAKAPLGSTEVNAPALVLMAPPGELSNPRFSVDVYAAPESTVSFTVGDTKLKTTMKTNKVGHATGNITIPDSELGGASFIGRFDLTATVTKGVGTGSSVTQTLDYRVNRADDAVASEQELSFEHAGQKVYLVQNGKNNDNVFYWCILASHRLSTYSPTWPFTSVLDSARPLENTAMLTMKALDGTMNYSTLELASAQDVGGGITRYTYKGDVPIGDGDVNHDLTVSDIPYAFEVLPNYAEANYTTSFTQYEVDAFKATKRHTAELWYGQAQADVSRALATNGIGADEQTDYYYQFARESYDWLVANGEDPDKKDALSLLFNRNFEHQKWDKDNEYDRMSDADKKVVDDFEAAMVDLCDLWQEYYQDDKPLYEYKDMNDYLANNFGYRVEPVKDPKDLEAQGYLIAYDNNPQAGECQWYAVSHEYTAYDEDDLSAQASGPKGKGKVKVVKSDGSVMEKAYEWWGNQSAESKVGQVWGGVGVAVAGLNKKALASSSVFFKEAAAFGSKCVGAAGCAITIVVTTYDNLVQDAPKYWNRMYDIADDMKKIRDKKAYYEKQGKTGTPCYQALLTEESYLKRYREVNDAKIYLSIGDTVVSSEIAFVSATCPEASVIGAAGSAAAGTAWSAGTYFAGKELASRGDAAKATYERKTAARKQACGEKQDPKHKARVGIDPSGYVFEATEDNRLEGVTATIYENVDGAWQKWDAEDWDQVNDQVTGSKGIYGWEVPAGQWKVVFAKDGYEGALIDLGQGYQLVDVAETPALDVPPEWTDIAVGLLATTSPVVMTCNAEGSEAVVAFNQYMKTSAVPHVTLGGETVSAAWDSPMPALNEKGVMEPMSKVLRVALPASARCREGVRELVVTDGVGYSGKTMMELHWDLSIPADTTIQEMYRLYNPNSGEHFYTASEKERDDVDAAGWNYEGVGWIAPKTSDTPVYRLYSGTDHHYTKDKDERDWLVNDIGWKDEGIGWYSDDAEGVPLYRQYNPFVDPAAPTNNSGSHNYTTSLEENDHLVSLGWKAEGIGWHGVK